MASVGLILNPEQKVFKSTGVIDQAATINFYTSGASSVRQKVYHDKEGEVAQGNPLDYSDLNGGAIIYGDPSITYRQVTVSGAGSTLSTIDTITPIMPREQLSSAMDVSTYSIVSDSGVNIPLAPSSSGQVVLDGLYFPSQEGSANLVLGTLGNGYLYWRPNGIIISGDTTPQLGGDLDANAFNIKFDNASGIKDQNGNECLYFYTTSSAANYIKITNAATGNSPTIQAQGSDDNIDIKIAGRGTGAVKLSGVAYPTSDGNANAALTTSGSGSISLIEISHKLLKTQFTTITPSLTTSSYTATPEDDTVPQSNEGVQVESFSYTPTNANSILRISFKVSATPLLPYGCYALYSSSSSSALAVFTNYSSTLEFVGEYFEPAASTSSRTYSIRVHNVSGDTDVYWGLQRKEGFVNTYGDNYGGVYSDYIIIEEFLT